MRVYEDEEIGSRSHLADGPENAYVAFSLPRKEWLLLQARSLLSSVRSVLLTFLVPKLFACAVFEGLDVGKKVVRGLPPPKLSFISKT